MGCITGRIVIQLIQTMKRNIKSFEPDDDVSRMLDRAIKDGIRVTHVLNQAAREWLVKKGYARKKEQAPQ